MQEIQEKQYGRKLLFWIAGAAVISLILAPLLQQGLDIYLMYHWAQGLAQGFFNAYDGHVASLDYPPMYFIPLWVIGKIDQAVDMSGSDALIQFSLKVVPIAFYMLCVWSTYRIALRYADPKGAYRAALFMLLCPTLFINSVYWAQMDCILIFFVLWFFFLLDDGRPLAATVVFALCGVMKLQTLFFLPAFVMYLWFRYPLKKVIFCGVTGIALAYAVFIPFIIPRLSILYGEAAASGLSFFPALTQAIRSSVPLKDGVLLPFNLYFGSYNSYPYASMNACNFWTFCGLNMKSGSLTQPLIADWSWLTAKSLGGFFLAAALLFPVGYMIAAKIRKWDADVWTVAFVSMQTVYMLSAMMHDRYQIVVLPLLMMIWLKKKDARFGLAFILTTGVTCVNHLLTLIGYSTWTLQQFLFHGAGSVIFIVVSMLNLVLYGYTIIISWGHLFPGAGRPDKTPGSAFGIQG